MLKRHFQYIVDKHINILEGDVADLESSFESYMIRQAEELKKTRD